MDRRHVSTNNKRLKRKNMSITESLTKIRMSALKEARNKFGFSSVWTANGKIVQRRRWYKYQGLFWLIKWQAGVVLRENRVFFILMTSFYFYLLGGVFTKHSKTVGYFVFLILFRSILPLIKIILIKTQFVHFISLNITILLCLQFANLDCNKILTSISQLYHLTISCVKTNGQ